MPKPESQTAKVKSEAEVLNFEEKTARNKRMTKRYDEIMRLGLSGHYEAMFRVWNEEFELAKRMSQ